MTEPLSVVSNRIRVNNNINSYVFTIGSIAATESEEIEVTVSLQGILRGIRVVNTSIDFDVSIRTASGVTPPSIKEIFKVEDINLTYNEVGLEIPYISEEHLYINIKNTDSSHATGEFELELLISIE
jgi:hypothetical protein